jgi:hypothetical protein
MKLKVVVDAPCNGFTSTYLEGDAVFRSGYLDAFQAPLPLTAEQQEHIALCVNEHDALVQERDALRKQNQQFADHQRPVLCERDKLHIENRDLRARVEIMRGWFAEIVDMLGTASAHGEIDYQSALRVAKNAHERTKN